MPKYIDGSRLPDPTAYVVSDFSIANWRAQFEPIALNRYEGQSLRGFLEEMDYLLGAQDALYELRAQCQPSQETGWPSPSEQQRTQIYQQTKVYFDTYYGALSHLSSVVARFSGIFKKNFSDNSKFINWLKSTFIEDREPGPDLTYYFLEQARLFRALLNHPQQFPVIDWVTETNNVYRVPQLVLVGPESRSGKIPLGSGRFEGNIDFNWRFTAPQEISVSNSLGNAAVSVLSRILLDRSSLSSFVVRDELLLRLRRSLEQTPNSGHS